jgi:hypothetical protein
MDDRMDLQKIPTPADMALRPNTGPMRFVGNWPGVFIRGDEALHYAAVIEMAIKNNDELKRNSILASLVRLLKSCRVPQECD